MSAPHGDIVPFGKYKGRPMVDLLSDRDYSDWLTAQPWFRKRYATVYSLIVGGGGIEPQDTPEHNAMQARFLDHDEVLRVCRVHLPDKDAVLKRWDWNAGIHMSEHGRANLSFADRVTAMVDRLKFEHHGWDLYVQASSGVGVTEVSGPACSCTDRSENERGHRAADCYFRYSGEIDYMRTLESGVTWGACPIFGIELKPIIGDDYPTVLRDVLRRAEMCSARGCCRISHVVVVADRVDFSTVGVDKVRKIFKSQKVALVLTDELPVAAEEWACQCEECQP